MKKNATFPFIVFIILHFATYTFAQSDAQAKVLCQLPPQLGESSGIYVASANRIWSHSDSGNPNALYLIDSTGTLKRTVVVRNATNIDWEEMTTDTLGNVYVGDFGNNANARRDLVIYKILNFNNLQKDTFDAGLIKFTYPDQTAFPPDLSNYVYDCEAMLVFSDSIFLVTKDYHAIPYPGITRIYRIPNAIGTHVATFVAQVNTDNSTKEYGAITGMALSPDWRSVVLIAHRRIYIAQNFTGRAFWAVKWRSANINSSNNKEAVGFIDNCNLYLTDDKGGIPTGFLYTLNICSLATTLAPTKELTSDHTPLSIKCFPNPSTTDESIGLTFSKTLTSATLDLFDATGKLFFTIKGINSDSYNIGNNVFKDHKGLFFIRLYDKVTNDIICQKIIKQ